MDHATAQGNKEGLYMRSLLISAALVVVCSMIALLCHQLVRGSGVESVSPSSTPNASLPTSGETQITQVADQELRRPSEIDVETLVESSSNRSAPTSVVLPHGALQSTGSHIPPVPANEDSRYDQIYENEILTTFHDNGLIMSHGLFVDGKKEGYWQYLSEKGTTQLDGYFANGKSEGRWTAWREDGTLFRVSNMKNSLKHGECAFYLADGSKDATRGGYFSNGVRIETP